MVKIEAKKNVRAINEELAQENASFFNSEQVFVVNLMSSPGAGKTTLLETTLKVLKDKFKIGVIEGDLQTSKDADRIKALGVLAYQINTNGGCHLDAKMIKETLGKIAWKELDILFIENVGNLVCPASFYLGEHKKVVLLSTAEGSDKPAKYPKMFRQADLVLINKMDIAQYCDFDTQVAEEDLHKIKPNMNVIKMSCRENNGLETWYKWLEEQVEHFKK